MQIFDKKVSRRTFMAMAAATAAGCALDKAKIRDYAKAMGPKGDYPTVIIGAGLGGLCCGSYLAQQGIPVTVVEQHQIPGGYATSFKRGSGKFNFEVSLHGTSMNNNTAARILHDVGVLDQMKLVELPEFYSLKVPGQDIMAVPERDPEAYISLLGRKFPNEEQGIRSFVQEMTGIAEEADLLSQENPTVKGLFYKLRFPGRFPKMWKVRNQTLSDLLNAHVKGEAVKEYLAALWGYHGLPPSRLSGFYYAVATGDYLKNGSYYIRERSQDLSNALAKTIESSGGQVLYGAKAESILVENGVIKGVELRGKRILPARAVVSNASAITTFKQMLPPSTLPASYMERIDTYRPSISSFMVWLGLKEEIRNKIKHAHIYVSTEQGSETSYESMLKGDVEKLFFGVSFYDNIFEGYSRPGSSTVSITTLTGFEPWKQFADDYRAGRKDAYNQEKQRWADILIKRAEEQVMPGLSTMIEVKEASTPLTNWRFTGNTQGAIYGFEQSMDNSYMKRIDNRTPLKGLYLASAWGSPGGGFAGVLMSGQQAFLKMMEDWGG
jgi:phytoene dehydrogenase-like protein